MLKINIIAVGKNKETWVDDAIGHYEKLLKKFVKLSFEYIPDQKKSSSLSENEVKRQEASAISKRLDSGHKIALSDKGRKYNSEEFADYLSKLMQQSGGAVEFIIGGAYGLDSSVINECDDVVSLSPMTMSHQLIRPVLLEQLYRGFSILSGGKYHK
jgi:23S rRNA (pseudouridine1915-N3)-methyltransferase